MEDFSKDRKDTVLIQDHSSRTNFSKRSNGCMRLLNIAKPIIFLSP